jgi:stage IV sporulation protein B
MESGEVCGVILGGVHKGECGKPGELSGILKDDTVGRIDSNNECGVFGNLTALPSLSSKTAIPIGTKAEVQEGEATIISTLKNGKSAEYKIEIYDIDKTSEGSKSFRIRTNDPALIAISGGIVRGMSGSPIIQNGKLVCTATHVLANDPTRGYGIFIKNMLACWMRRQYNRTMWALSPTNTTQQHRRGGCPHPPAFYCQSHRLMI